MTPELQSLMRRHREACDFKQPHDPEKAADALLRWIRACGFEGDMNVRAAKNWEEAASAAWAAWAASAAWAAWDASYVSITAIGAQELSDESTRAKWLPLLEALEAGAWMCWVLPNEIVYVPVPQIKSEGATLTCLDGPAMVSLDLSLWFIDGLKVDEQIVMRPETQTIAQIDGEKNADVRSIRISRFGWPRYLKDSGAEPRHVSENYVTGCPEALYRTKDGNQRLVVVCPTGRQFAMGVPPEIETCEQAQRWLAPFEVNILSAT